MLSARAYSFRQQSRLAISLSWIGGYTNVVALLSCGYTVSHITGTATNVGHALGESQFQVAFFFLFLLVCFFLGAVISAFMTEGARRQGIASKNIWPIGLEALLLAAFAIISYRHNHVAPEEIGWRYALTGIASMAMGLQNATITRISGSVVRTTHITGVITDLGIEGVQFFHWWLDTARGRWAARAGRLAKVSQRHPLFLRLLLLASILGSFLLGATLGTLAYLKWPELAMIPPVLFLGWIIFVDYRKPITDVRELDLLSDPDFKAEHLVKAMLPPELGLYRFIFRRSADHHRMPNFQLWVDQLPPRWRVVILAVSPLTHFDDNSAIDLRVALQRLEASGRKLILCGVTQSQVRALDHLGVARIMDVSNLCPDLEFAIARGMALLHEMQTAPPDEAARTPAPARSSVVAYYDPS